MGETQPIEVIELGKFEERLKTIYVPFLCDEIIKRTDQRYFTRNKIYTFLIVILSSIICFAWQHASLVKAIQDLENKGVPDVHRKPGHTRRYTYLPQQTGRFDWRDYRFFFRYWTETN